MPRNDPGYHDFMIQQDWTSRKPAAEPAQAIAVKPPLITWPYRSDTDKDMLHEPLSLVSTHQTCLPGVWRSWRNATPTPEPFYSDESGRRTQPVTNFTDTVNCGLTAEELLNEAISLSKQYQSEIRTPSSESTNRPPRYTKAAGVPAINQREHQLIPPSMTQTGDPSIELIDPGPQDSSRPRSPMRSSFDDRGSGKLDQPFHEILTQPFQRLDLSEGEAKDRRRFATKEPAKVVRKRSSSSGERSSRRYEFYKFDKRGADWTIADRVSITAPQNEIRQKVTKGKGRCNITDRLVTMNSLRRDQINRLLDQKNQFEKDKDAEWVPVFIETRRQLGNSVLSFEIVIAQTLKSMKRPSFADEKSDLRDPVESKEHIVNRQRGPQSHVHDMFQETRLFTDKGMATKEGMPANEAKPLGIRRSIKTSELDPFDNQRLFALNNDLTRPFNVNVHNFDVSDPGRLSNNQDRTNIYHRPNNSSSMFDLEARKLDYFGDERQLRNSHRATCGGPKEGEGHNIDISDRTRVVEDEICIMQGFLPEDSAQPHIYKKSQPNIESDLHAVERERSPKIGNKPDQIDIGRPFGMSFIFPHSRADSAYYSASDNMSSRCESVSPILSQKREFLTPSLEHNRAFDEVRQPSSSGIGSRNYVVDLVALRRPTAPTSPISSKAQNHPAIKGPELVDGDEDVDVWRKLTTTNADTPLSMPATLAVPVSSMQTSLQLRPKNEKTSSFHCPSAKDEVGCDISATESTALPAKSLKDPAYYCSIRGCVYSANPGLCDLGPPIASKIHDSEAHKIYMLDGLPETGLAAHVREDHKEEIVDFRVWL